MSDNKESKGAYAGAYPGEVIHPETDYEYWDKVAENAAGVNAIQRVFVEMPSSVIAENQVRAEDIQNVIPLQDDVREERESRERSMAAAREARRRKSELKNKPTLPEVEDEKGTGATE